MIDDRWDPGNGSLSRIRWGIQESQQEEERDLIWNRQGNLESGAFSDLGDTGKEREENNGAIDGRSWFDTSGSGEIGIITMKPHCSKGTRVIRRKSKDQLRIEEITKNLLNLLNSTIWKVVSCFFMGLNRKWLCFTKSFRDLMSKIMMGRYGNYLGIFFLGKKASWVIYIGMLILNNHHITLITFSFNFSTKALVFWFSVVLRMQSQLVGKKGDLKNGEGARKRLRISVPHFDNTEIIKNYERTLVGRCMNPPEQNMAALVSNLPKIWTLENRVAGVDLGHGKFQFDFDAEEDIEEVLKNQPYHFDYWMLSIARWQPKKSRDYPSEITFWIKVVGVPGDYWGEPTFQSIGDAIGRTVKVDLDFGRIQVVVDAFKELVFDTTVDFNGGEFEEWISLEYEKLFGYCETCFSLCHITAKCPLTMKSPVVKQQHRIDDNRGHDARARSYRGVVLNGNKDHHERERGNREYYGKGKGKMVEEPSSRWAKVEQKRPYSSRSHSGGEGNASRRPDPVKEQVFSQETREENNNELRGRDTRPSAQVKEREGEREEGEIQRSVSRDSKEVSGTPLLPPSREFEEALRATQEEPTKVLPYVLEQNLSLEGLKEKSDGTNVELSVEEGSMVLDAMVGDFGDLERDLQDLTEEDFEEDGPKENLTKVEGGKQGIPKDDKGKGPGDIGKKQGTRKGPFVTGGSTKMRLVQTLLANPKKNPPKTGIRRGEGTKQVEEKGTSNSTLPDT